MYLFFIRHGQSEGNVLGRLQGWQDAALTRLGERQAVHAALILTRFLQAAEVPIAAIYASPLQRAARTAGVISQALGLPLQLDPDLREMHFGDVEGLTEAEWQDCFPDLLRAWSERENLDFGWPDGETRRTFYHRIDSAISRIVRRHAPAENVVLVTHGGVISSYLAYVISGEWHQWGRFPVGNCSITHLTLEPGRDSPPAVACLLSLPAMGEGQDADMAAVAART